MQRVDSTKLLIIDTNKQTMLGREREVKRREQISNATSIEAKKKIRRRDEENKARRREVRI